MKHPAILKVFFAIACVFAGWVSAFAMSPVSFWPCLFIGLSSLYWLYSKTNGAGQAFASGFFFAIGYFVTGLWWIGNALLVEGNEFRWVWPISVIGLPTLLGLFTGTYLAIARMIADPKMPKGFWAFVFFLTFSEWARGNAFTGFPWNLYGYVWADHLPMAQMAHYIGAYGMTFLSVLWAALAGYLFLHKAPIKRKFMLCLATAFAMLFIYNIGKARLDSNPTVLDKNNALVVVQPNIPQDMKWDPIALQENFEKMVSISRAGDFGSPPPRNVYIVWPETAISPQIYTQTTNMDLIQSLLKTYTGSNAYLITGILLRTGQGEDVKYGNSVTMMNKDMDVLAVYNKYHLVPFGEFIPFQKWIPLKPVVRFKGFERGGGPATLAHANIPPFSPLICYEVIFPDVVTKMTGERPQWIVNVTNDGWYGDSAGPYQHFAQTRLRAIEEGLPVIRSANTGISGVIDPYGRIIEQGNIFEEAALVTHLPKPILGKNPYWPWILQLLLPIVALFFMVRLVVFKKMSYA